MNIVISKIFNSLSAPKLKYPILASFYNELNKFNSLKQPKRNIKEKKVTVLIL